MVKNRLTDLLYSAWDEYKDEGIAGVARQTLRYLSLYGAPSKLLREKLMEKINPVVIKEIQGSYMELDLRKGGIHQDLYMNGIREPEATKIMQQIIRPGMRVLDIGANIGYYALMEAKVCGEVIAIEPDNSNFKNLEKNVRLNHYGNILGYKTAVGDKEGTIAFELSKTPNWHRVAIEGDKNTTLVPITTVDTFLKRMDNPKIDLLRMDVEGYEFNILSGAVKTIERDKPNMFIEIHRDLLKNFGHSAKEVLGLLASYDYSIFQSFVIGRPSYLGKLKTILKNSEKTRILTEKGLATHIFFRG